MIITTFNRPKGRLDETVALVRARANDPPDIIAVQECRRPIDEGPQWAWDGLGGIKGVGIAVRADWSVRKGPLLSSNSARVFVVETPNTEFRVLNMWSHRDPYTYLAGVLKAIDEATSFLKSGTPIVLGDFNANPCFGEDFFAITSSLSDNLGLVSAYHRVHGIHHGEEHHPTYYHQRKVDKPFHIDYCFIRPHMLQGATVDVGSFSEWANVSDHRPLIVRY